MVIGEIRTGLELGRPSKSCRYIWHACESCGKTRWVQFYSGKAASPRCLQCGYKKAGALKSGEKNGNWKGGRHVDAGGYVVVVVDRGDFFRPMAGKRGHAYEHRLVMARHMNRCLLPWEVVHHKNGDRADNRLSNLQLLSGQASHVADSQMKRYVKKLERRIALLETRITQLEFLVTGGRNAIYS